MISNTSATVQKIFPGVSGPVIYFARFQVRCAVDTKVPVDFKALKIGSDSLIISKVMEGSRILNTTRGERLEKSSGNVLLEASKIVREEDVGSSHIAALLNAQTVTLIYQVDGAYKTHPVKEVEYLRDEYRPAAAPSQRE